MANNQSVKVELVEGSENKGENLADRSVRVYIDTAQAKELLGGDSESNQVSGSIRLNLEQADQQEIENYSKPFGEFNSQVSAKIMEARLTSVNGNIASFVDKDGNVIPWVDVLNAVSDRKRIDITDFEKLGYEASVDGGVISFEEMTCFFNSMASPCVTLSHLEGDGAATISGFGFIGSDVGVNNFGGYFYPWCIDIFFTRGEDGRFATATAGSVYFAVTSFNE